MLLDITVPTGRTHRPKQQKGTQWLSENQKNATISQDTQPLTQKILLSRLAAE